jgi:hypothetical protein
VNRLANAKRLSGWFPKATTIPGAKSTYPPDARINICLFYQCVLTSACLHYRTPAR